AKARAKLEAIRKKDEQRYQQEQLRQQQQFLNELREQWPTLSNEDREFYRRQMPELLQELEPTNGNEEAPGPWNPPSKR
ncbi:MAG: hypothetical protein ACRD9L_15205, partial [Bryobacteraceae bacterium]